jgi:hypothetical protein
MCGLKSAKTSALPREPVLGSLRALLRQTAAPASAPPTARETITKACAGAGIAEDVAGALADACLARRDDVRSAAGAALAAGVARAQLVDYDFRACVTVASDKAVVMNRPSVTVGLTLRRGGVDSNVVFEADDRELDSLIAQLERAEAAISELKV